MKPRSSNEGIISSGLWMVSKYDTFWAKRDQWLFNARWVKSHRDFIADYKLEFAKAYKALSRHPFSAGDVFVEDLNQNLASSSF
jgi:hypothetical protein